MANETPQSSSSPVEQGAEMAFGPAVSQAGVGPRANKRFTRTPASSGDQTQTQRIDGAASTPRSAVDDEQLVDQTKQQIRQLVTEISDLAKTDCSVQDFYQGFLTRTTGALASEGGAIWIRDAVDAPLKVHYHINLKQTVLATDQAAQKQHADLLNRIAEAGEPEIVAPHSQSNAAGHGGNPTDKLLIFCPLVVNRQVIGLVEILQRPGAGPTTQRGYLRFLLQMCELASEFLTNERIRSFAAQQALWGKFDQFVHAVYSKLDTRQTAYGVANEGRRVIGCDRVSVLLGKGRALQVHCVSGLDSVERRSDQVKHLARLARAVVKGRSPVWYDSGSDLDNDQKLPPQIETKLHQFIDRSHSKTVAIIPLFETRASDQPEDGALSRTPDAQTGAATPIGALVVEQLKDSAITEDYRKRVQAVVGHSEIALTNALEHNSIFLMPLWKAIGKSTALVRGRNLIKTLVASLAVMALVGVLWLLPYPFSVAAKGKLMPEVQRAVYAQSPGLIEELFVSDHGDTPVETGQLLARMSNNDLAVQIENLRNSILEAATRQATNQALQSKGGLDDFERETLAVEAEKARQEQIGLKRELNLRLIEQENLNVKATTSGVVINWQARQNLVNRPVERGQNLMTIVDPTSEWLLELELPERRLGHLLETLKKNAQDDSQANSATQGQASPGPEVTFALVSLPGKEFQGRMKLIDRQLDVHSDEGNTCLVQVAFDNQTLDQSLLRTGTRVNAKIECGTRSLGYVMFHEAIETVQSKWLLWF